MKPDGHERGMPAWLLESILTIILLVLCAMIRVQQCARRTTRGYQVAAHREQVQRLREEIDQLECDYSRLIAGDQIAARVRAIGLPLVPPEDARGTSP